MGGYCVVDWEDLIDRYLSAFNDHDVDAVLDLMHPGVAFYDAFWGETCVGSDMRQYFEDWFAVDPYQYTRFGEIVVSDDGAAYRYNTVNVARQSLAESAFRGAEVLTAKHGKLLTISDYYVDPNADALEEVIGLSVLRHGQSKYATKGFSAARKSRLRRKIQGMVNTSQLHLDADLTVRQLAEMIGCTPGELIELAIGSSNTNTEVMEDELVAGPATQIIEKIVATPH